MAKTTIYRNWGSRSLLMFDLLIHRSQELPDIDPDAPLHAALTQLTKRIARLVVAEPFRHILPGLLADIAGDAELRREFQARFVDPALQTITTLLQNGVIKGELLVSPEPHALHAGLMGAGLLLVMLDSNFDEDTLAATLNDHAHAIVGVDKAQEPTEPAHGSRSPPRGAGSLTSKGHLSATRET